MKLHQRHYYKAKCVSVGWMVMTVDCEWAVCNGGGGGARYRRTALLSDEASCYTVVVCQAVQLAVTLTLFETLDILLYCCQHKVT
jgi:hypothetical protein